MTSTFLGHTAEYKLCHVAFYNEVIIQVIDEKYEIRMTHLNEAINCWQKEEEGELTHTFPLSIFSSTSLKIKRKMGGKMKWIALERHFV